MSSHDAVTVSLSNRELIERARNDYQKLLNREDNAYFFAEFIVNDLKLAGVGLEALDPTGKRSAAEMETEFRAIYREVGLTQARKDLLALDSQNIDSVKEIIRFHGFTPQDVLNSGGVNLSPEEADKKLTALFRDAYLKEARASLISGTTRDVKYWMSQGGLSAQDVLNSGGGVNLSPEEADKKLTGIFRDLNLKEVRNFIASDLKTSGSVHAARDIMKAYGFAAQDVVNCEGVNLSPDEAAKRLEDIFRDVYIRDARFAAKQGGAALKDAGIALKLAGFDADTNGDRTYSAKEIDIVIKALEKLPPAPPLDTCEGPGHTPAVATKPAAVNR